MNFFLQLFFSFLFLAGSGHAETEPSITHPVPPSTPSPTPFPFENVQPTAQEDHFTRDLMQMLLTLGMIVGMIFVITWFLKKMLNTRIQQLNTSSDIKILERRSLTPKTAIYLLDVKGKGIIIGESTNGLTRLADFNLDNPSKSPSFSQVMLEKNEME